MLMGLKYQVNSCKHIQEVVALTMNHIEWMKNAAENNQEVKKPLLAMEKRFIEVLSVGIILIVPQLCSNFSPYQLMLLRYHLLRFCQEKRVKVSSFLQQQIQTSTGILVIPTNVYLPPRAKMPGFVRYLNFDCIY